MVAPEGPAAAPRRAVRKFTTSFAWLRCKAGGTMASGKGTWLVGGRLAGSARAASVAALAGARGGAVRAELAAESSPSCAKAAARSARVCISSRAFFRLVCGFVPLAAAAASSKSCWWWPAARVATRRCNSSSAILFSPCWR